MSVLIIRDICFSNTEICISNTDTYYYIRYRYLYLLFELSVFEMQISALNRLDVLDEIWDVTESVSEGFLTYS